MGRTRKGENKKINTGFTIDPKTLEQFDAMIGKVPRSTCLSNLIQHVVNHDISITLVLG